MVLYYIRKKGVCPNGGYKKMAKTTLANWFHGLNKIIQVILLLIPFVNYIVEVVVRWSAWLKAKNPLGLIIAIIVTLPSGLIVGWLDAIWVLLFNRLIGEK